jgi:hypothetical protein
MVIGPLKSASEAQSCAHSTLVLHVTTRMTTLPIHAAQFHRKRDSQIVCGPPTV